MSETNTKITKLEIGVNDFVKRLSGRQRYDDDISEVFIIGSQATPANTGLDQQTINYRLRKPSFKFPCGRNYHIRSIRLSDCLTLQELLEFFGAFLNCPNVRAEVMSVHRHDERLPGETIWDWTRQNPRILSKLQTKVKKFDGLNCFLLKRDQLAEYLEFPIMGYRHHGSYTALNLRKVTGLASNYPTMIAGAANSFDILEVSFLWREHFNAILKLCKDRRSQLQLIVVDSLSGLQDLSRAILVDGLEQIDIDIRNLDSDLRSLLNFKTRQQCFSFAENFPQKQIRSSIYDNLVRLLPGSEGSAYDNLAKLSPASDYLDPSCNIKNTDHSSPGCPESEMKEDEVFYSDASDTPPLSPDCITPSDFARARAEREETDKEDPSLKVQPVSNRLDKILTPEGESLMSSKLMKPEPLEADYPNYWFTQDDAEVGSIFSNETPGYWSHPVSQCQQAVMACERKLSDQKIWSGSFLGESHLPSIPLGETRAWSFSDIITQGQTGGSFVWQDQTPTTKESVKTTSV